MTDNCKRHDLDKEAVAERIRVDPACIDELCKQAPEDVTLTDVEAYVNAIGVVRTKDELTLANVEGETTRALMTFSGYFFPFPEGEYENNIREVLEMAGYDE